MIGTKVEKAFPGYGAGMWEGKVINEMVISGDGIQRFQVRFVDPDRPEEPSFQIWTLKDVQHYMVHDARYDALPGRLPGASSGRLSHKRDLDEIDLDSELEGDEGKGAPAKSGGGSGEGDTSSDMFLGVARQNERMASRGVSMGGEGSPLAAAAAVVIPVAAVPPPVIDLTATAKSTARMSSLSTESASHGVIY